MTHNLVARRLRGLGIPTHNPEKRGACLRVSVQGDCAELRVESLRSQAAVARRVVREAAAALHRAGIAVTVAEGGMTLHVPMEGLNGAR